MSHTQTLRTIDMYNMCVRKQQIPQRNEETRQLSPLFSPLAASGLAVSVGTVGPLSLGEDELVYTVASGGEADLNVRALMETRGLTYRPASIISFNSDCGSVGALVSGSEPVSVIGTAEDAAAEDYHLPAGLATTSGVTEVVAMAEVSFQACFSFAVTQMSMWVCVLKEMWCMWYDLNQARKILNLT